MIAAAAIMRDTQSRTDATGLVQAMRQDSRTVDLDRARRLAEQARDVALPATARALVENMASTIDAMAAEIEELRGRAK